MGQLHQHNLPINDKHSLLQWLQATMPQYSPKIRGVGVIMGSGSTTGLMVVPKGPGKIKTLWGMPSMGTQIFINLTFLLGILTGVILILIVWGSVKGNVKAMEQQVANALAGGQPMHPGQQPMHPGQQPMHPGQQAHQAGPPPQGFAPPQAGPAQLGPGSSVMVTASDGNAYQGTVVQAAQGQFLCSFSNGTQEWYPATSVRPA